MRVLIVIGAGASYDSWLPTTPNPSGLQRLPLANDLFHFEHVQNNILQEYKLMGLASLIRSSEHIKGTSKFNIEEELANINDQAIKRGDLNKLQYLFKARFYIHELIRRLNDGTIQVTSDHTVYVDLISKVKSWIDEQPAFRFVDLVVFNYDTLIESAMEQVFSSEWHLDGRAPISHYYAHRNIKIFKPHGSINWVRKIEEQDIKYHDMEEAFRLFNKVTPANEFLLKSSKVFRQSITKDYIPAIAIPYMDKVTFEECPSYMLVNMQKAVSEAEKMITLGWKAGDSNFTSLISKTSRKLNQVVVVSPHSDSKLSSIVSPSIVESIESTFSHFVSGSTAFDNLLNSFS